MHLSIRVGLLLCVSSLACGARVLDEPLSESGSETSSSSAGEESSGTETGGAEVTGPATTTQGHDTGASGGATAGTGGSSDCYAPENLCYASPFTRFGCGGAQVCDELVIFDPTLVEGAGPLEFENPAAATCILEGLRDRTVGTYAVAVDPNMEFSRRIDIEVLGDGSVIVHDVLQEDKCADEHGSWEPLRASAEFQACLGTTDEQAQYECLAAPGDAESCVEAPTVCP